ncbi:MAG: tripartite tricarboxylate transporter TctB family protein [Deltaproteobacteria bacterium]|nr:tripartite tricarboxylate transporter TctB family protein [Deltaproteobacteria bacterium]
MKQISQDVFISIVGLIVVVICLIFTNRYTSETAFFPRSCLILLGVLLIAMLIETLIRAKKENKLKPELANKSNIIPFLTVTGLLAAYSLAIKFIGFYTSTALLLVVVGLSWGSVSKKSIFIFTGCFIIFLYVCFTVLFNVPLPTGLVR